MRRRLLRWAEPPAADWTKAKNRPPQPCLWQRIPTCHHMKPVTSSPHRSIPIARSIRTYCPAKASSPTITLHNLPSAPTRGLGSEAEAQTKGGQNRASRPSPVTDRVIGVGKGQQTRGPPTRRLATIAVSSSAAEAYSALNEFHAPAAANNDPGPGPALNSAECTSGGEAIQIGVVIISGPRSDRTMPAHHRSHNSCAAPSRRHRSDWAPLHPVPPPPYARRHERSTRSLQRPPDRPPVAAPP